MKLSTTIVTSIVGMLATSLAVNGIQYYRSTKMDLLLEVEKKRNEINTDQINEFILSGNRHNISNDPVYAESQGYVRGILSVVTKASPQDSEISSIWHNGYERGLSQSEFVGEMQYEKGYQSGFNIGQQETMKALSTIMKSGDNIQSAIKNFVDDQSKKLESKPVEIQKPVAKENK